MQTLNTEIPTVSYVNQCQIWGGWKHTVLEIERREKKRQASDCCRRPNRRPFPRQQS